MSDELEIYLVREDEDEESWRIAVGADVPKWYSQFRKVDADSDEITSEMIAEYLDQDAENENAHSFVGVHAYLMNVYDELHDNLDMDWTFEFMMRLLKDGGLHGLNRGRRK